MRKAGVLTKALAVAGVVLAWFPIAATVVTAVAGSIMSRAFRCDFMMPAELFPFAVAGAALLLWAALRWRSRYRAIGWGLGLMVVFLGGSQLVAVVTGMATGEREPAGWPFALAIAGLAVYTAALIVVAVVGALLVRDVFGRRGAPGRREQGR